jgi:hypothetical protein
MRRRSALLGLTLVAVCQMALAAQDHKTATYNLGPATGTYRLAGLVALTIQMTGRVVVDPVSTATSGSAPCQSAACTSTATAGGVQLVVQYDITNDVGSVGSFVVTTDLGSTLAQTTYKAAPSA